MRGQRNSGDEDENYDRIVAFRDQDEVGRRCRRDAYERLLGDGIHGDAILFVREDEVEAAWSIVQPIIRNVTFANTNPASAGPPKQII